MEQDKILKIITVINELKHLISNALDFVCTEDLFAKSSHRHEDYGWGCCGSPTDEGPFQVDPGVSSQ